MTGIEIPAKGCGHEIPVKGTMPASAGWVRCEAMPLVTGIAPLPNLAYCSRPWFPAGSGDAWPAGHLAPILIGGPGVSRLLLPSQKGALLTCATYPPPPHHTV